MTPEDFSKNPDNRDRLKAALADPVLQEALTTLVNELMPLPKSNADSNPVLGASRYQQLAGANHIVEGLQRLTQIPRPQVKLTHARLAREEEVPKDWNP